MTKAKDKSLSLNSLSDSGSKQNRKRVGRGIGSGTGKTAGETIKDKNQDLVDQFLDGLKVDKCHFSKDFKIWFSSRVNNFSTDLNLKAVDEALKKLIYKYLKIIN